MRRTDGRRPSDLSPLRSSARDQANRSVEFEMGTATDLGADWAEGPLAAWELAWIDLGGEG